MKLQHKQSIVFKSHTEHLLRINSLLGLLYWKNAWQLSVAFCVIVQGNCWRKETRLDSEIMHKKSKNVKSSNQIHV